MVGGVAHVPSKRGRKFHAFAHPHVSARTVAKDGVRQTGRIPSSISTLAPPFNALSSAQANPNACIVASRAR